jgi:L-iditol 2-dehydrogenase
MASTATNPLKPNVGVYTNPAHDLWIESATPHAEGLDIGNSLQPGEVTVGIKSSGICG